MVHLHYLLHIFVLANLLDQQVPISTMPSPNLLARRRSNRQRGIAANASLPTSIYGTARINTLSQPRSPSQRYYSLGYDRQPRTPSPLVMPSFQDISLVHANGSPPSHRRRLFTSSSYESVDAPDEASTLSIHECLKRLQAGSILSHTLAENHSMHRLQSSFLSSLGSNIVTGVVGMMHCPQCKERWIDTRFSIRRGPNRTRQCIDCAKSATTFATADSNGNSVPLRILSAANDFDPWPEYKHLLLPKLNSIEEMLIARVHPFMRVYRLESGVLGYKGGIANLEQDTLSFINQLPSLPSEVPVFIIRKPNINSPTGYKDFKINRDHIMAWLMFLKEHSRYYHDVNLSSAANRAAQLPEDGELAEGFRTIDEGKFK